MGGLSQPGAGRSGFSTVTKTDVASVASQMRCDTNQVAWPFPSSAQCSESTWALFLQTGPAERLLAMHLHQRPSEAHHNLDVLPRGLYPCAAAPLAASLFSASAVISIRQGCNKFEAVVQREMCTRSRCVELILTAKDGPSGITPRVVFELCVRDGTEGTILRCSAHCFQPVRRGCNASSKTVSSSPTWLKPQGTHLFG